MGTSGRIDRSCDRPLRTDMMGGSGPIMAAASRSSPSGRYGFSPSPVPSNLGHTSGASPPGVRPGRKPVVQGTASLQPSAAGRNVLDVVEPGGLVLRDLHLRIAEALHVVIEGLLPRRTLGGRRAHRLLATIRDRIHLHRHRDQPSDRDRRQRHFGDLLLAAQVEGRQQRADADGALGQALVVVGLVVTDSRTARPEQRR